MSECNRCHGNGYYKFRDETIQCPDCITPETVDEINRPEHYNLGQEPFPFITSWGMSFAEGCVIKYVVRHKHKDGLKDLKKAAWYLKQMIEDYEA
tara:strand:+ start:670 stop:954 length:285 start_codon:yes stop_codon:yes gene_type:complete